MTDDLIIVAVPGWILARDRHGGTPSWRRHDDPLAPGTIVTLPPLPERGRWPFRLVTNTQEQRT